MISPSSSALTTLYRGRDSEPDTASSIVSIHLYLQNVSLQKELKTGSYTLSHYKCIYETEIQSKNRSQIFSLLSLTYQNNLTFFN